MSSLLNLDDPRITDRIWNKISPCPMTSCWLWTGTFAGGPQIRWKIDDAWKVVNVRHILAALVGIEAAIISSDCSHCVNPAHYLGFADHTEASAWSAQNNRMTFCKNGHSFDDAYEYIASDGHRYRRCRTCQALATATRTRARLKRRLRHLTPSSRERTLAKSEWSKMMWRSGALTRPDGTTSPAAQVP